MAGGFEIQTLVQLEFETDGNRCGLILAGGIEGPTIGIVFVGMLPRDLEDAHTTFPEIAQAAFGVFGNGAGPAVSVCCRFGKQVDFQVR